MKDEECSCLDRRHTNSKVPEATKEHKCRRSCCRSRRHWYHGCLPPEKSRIDSRTNRARTGGLNRHRPYNCSPHLCHRRAAPSNWCAISARIMPKPPGMQAQPRSMKSRELSKKKESSASSRACRLICTLRVDASSKKEASSLKKEADLAAKLGFDAAYLNSAPYFNLPAVRFANQAKFHPRKYLRSLVAKISGSGSHVFEKSAASEFDAKKRRVKVNRNWISFDRVVMATNNPLVGLASMTARRFCRRNSLFIPAMRSAPESQSETIPEALFLGYARSLRLSANRSTSAASITSSSGGRS